MVKRKERGEAGGATGARGWRMGQVTSSLGWRSVAVGEGNRPSKQRKARNKQRLREVSGRLFAMAGV